MLLISGVAQVLLQLLPLARKGVRLRPCFDFRHPGLKQILTLFLPMIVGLAPMQLNVSLDNIIARTMGQVGANSVFFYANRLMQFPLAIIGIAMGTAVFPLLSRYSAAQEHGKLNRAVSGALRLTLFISLPAAMGLAILGKPLIRLFFEHGRFAEAAAGQASAVDRTSLALLFYAAGVWAFCCQQIITRFFYAMKDSKTPVKVAVSMVGLNLLLNILLIGPLDAAGLALATTFSQTLNLTILVLILRKRGHGLVNGEFLRFAGKVFAMTAAMGAVCFATLHLLPEGGGLMQAARVFVPALCGLAVFAAGAWLFRLEEFDTILSLIPGRKRS
jgi:putative peptidoglycan lipid II flippase